MIVFCLVPAAGKGTRFGMPKVDAMLEGSTFSQTIMETLRHTNTHDYLIIRDIDTPDMLSSIRYGMHKVIYNGTHPDGWLIWPVDHPLVKAATVNMLIETFRNYPNSVIIPQYGGKAGHPVIIPASMKIPDGTFSSGLKEIITLSGVSVHHIEVDDPAINENMNTPGDVHYV